jgi:hypothetical protein
VFLYLLGIGAASRRWREKIRVSSNVSFIFENQSVDNYIVTAGEIFRWRIQA